jgi:hypothetical protein
MPRYFFHLTNGVTLEDVDGENFNLLAEARGHAVSVALELARDGGLDGKSISVMDEQGVVVFKTPLADEE